MILFLSIGKIGGTIETGNCLLESGNLMFVKDASKKEEADSSTFVNYPDSTIKK